MLLPALLLTLVAPLAAFAQDDLTHLLQAIETRYNSPRTLQVLFEQSFSGAGRLTRTERGILYIQKPGRMLWEYSTPPGKFFLADGKFAYFYTPSTQQVSRTPLKESDDLRAPLAFLMGRLDFQRDFKEFRTHPEAADLYIAATPKSEKAPYTQVEFLVTPSRQIRLLKVTGQDRSMMEYRLAGEMLNPPLNARIFQFRLPEGARLLEEQ